jgi:hypothetical protein
LNPGFWSWRTLLVKNFGLKYITEKDIGSEGHSLGLKYITEKDIGSEGHSRRRTLDLKSWSTFCNGDSGVFEGVYEPLDLHFWKLERKILSHLFGRHCFVVDRSTEHFTA